MWHGPGTFRTALHPTLALGALFPLIVFTIVVNMAIGLLSVLLIAVLPLAHDVIIKGKFPIWDFLGGVTFHVGTRSPKYSDLGRF